MTVLWHMFPGEEITKSWGTGFYPAGFLLDSEPTTMAKPWYHWLPYRISAQSWKLVGAEFPSEFLRTKIGIVHVLRVCFCWIQFDPDGGFPSHGGNPKSFIEDGPMETTRFEASKFRNWWSIPRGSFPTAQPSLRQRGTSALPRKWRRNTGGMGFHLGRSFRYQGLAIYY